MATWLKQSTAVDVPIGPFVDQTDGFTAETGLTITQPDVRLKKNNGNWAQKAAAQTLTHEENGWYEVTLDATDTNTLGILVVAVNESGALPVWREFMVVPSQVWDSYLGADLLQVDAREVGGTTQTGRDIGANVLLSAGTGAGQLDFTSGVVKANLAQILGTALTETAGQIAAAFKKWFDVAAPVGTINSIPNATAGAAGGLFIAGSNAATTVNITGNLTGNVTGSVGSVTGAVGSVTGAVGSVTGAVGSVTGNVGGNVTGSVGSVAAGGITASSIAADAIGASELAADAVAEIAAAVSVGSAPTAAQNATAVRTELTTELARIDVAISTRAAGGAGLPGSGSRSHPILVTQPDGVTPIEGVSVWVSTDFAGTNVVAGTLETDTLGRINTTTGFMLDPGAYYLWRQHGDWNFTNPTAFTVV